MSKLDKLRLKLLARPVEMSFADVRLLLEADGWTMRKPAGSSHFHFTNAGRDRITVSVHDGKVKRSAVNEVADEIGRSKE